MIFPTKPTVTAYCGASDFPPLFIPFTQELLEMQRSLLSFIATVAGCLLAVATFFSGAVNADSANRESVVSLDGAEWSLATDPGNVGKEGKWWEKPVADAQSTKVPWIIQDAFPGYHGVAWYWRDFAAPNNPHAGGRYLLRFWNVDYLADVWVNGIHVGQHEGACEPFVLDVTDAIKPESSNRIAVRVLNPTNELIDGIKLSETPHTAKTLPWVPGRIGNWGGIVDSVELLVVPAARVEDLCVYPDWKTGKIRIHANLRNAGQEPVSSRLVFSVAPANGGETVNTAELQRELPVGDTEVDAELAISNHRLWQLEEPFLYNVTASLHTEDSCDKVSSRCGFRDFRVENGYYRLNGKRIFVKCSHTGADLPVGMNVPHNPDLLRRDILHCKVMGMNMIRSFNGLMSRRQLDLCDELGLLVYQENYASWLMEPSPMLAERFQRAVKAMVKRDRNHPSIVIWGILNETPKGPVFDQGAASLPLIRALDDSRLVLFSSGNWDGSEDTIANPGDVQFRGLLADQHPYQTVPHTAPIIQTLKTISGGAKPLFVSEYGVASALDVARLVRHYEQIGKTQCEDAMVFGRFLGQFMDDWNRWKMSEAFADPEDYFRQCLAWMAGIRKLGINAIRANPNVIGYSVTGTQDQGLTGEGLTANIFRELKPGIVDAMVDVFAPLRWCLFVEPMHVYRGRNAKLEAVLVNEDVLPPGEYPVRLQLIGPRNVRVFDRTIAVKIADPTREGEPKLAIPVFAEDVMIDGPAGKYRFLATFQKGGAAYGGDVEFYVADPAEMPKVDFDVVLWGEDQELTASLNAIGLKTSPFVAGAQKSREVIIVGSHRPADAPAGLRELARHIARGSHAVFLSPEVFHEGDSRTRWLPLANKGGRVDLPNWVYHKDDWAKNHPIFEGMPAGCVLDHTYYREIIGNSGWAGQDAPEEAVAGSINTSCGYSAGLLVGIYPFESGRFTINTLRIRENIAKDPVAERLVRNMLRNAAQDVTASLADLPPDFETRLQSIGY